MNVVKPEKVILFGSAATGTMTRDSDIDLLIVENEEVNRRQESLKIEESLSGLGFPFDIVVMQKDWFEASKDVIGGMAYPANKYCRVIYG